jgi:hypothetical protein
MFNAFTFRQRLYCGVTGSGFVLSQFFWAFTKSSYLRTTVTGTAGGFSIALAVDGVQWLLNQLVENCDTTTEKLIALRTEMKAYIKQLPPEQKFALYQNERAQLIDASCQKLSSSEAVEKKCQELDYVCPILQTIIREPVKAGDGHYYERSALQRWYDMGKRKCVLNSSIELVDPRTLVTDTKVQDEILSIIKAQSSQQQDVSTNSSLFTSCSIM